MTDDVVEPDPLEHAERWRPGGRICRACGRLRHLACRCSTAEQAGPLRARYAVLRDDAAAARRARLQQLADVDEARAEAAARRRRVVYSTVEQLDLLAE